MGKVVKAIAKPSALLGVGGLVANELSGGKLDNMFSNALLGEKSDATPNEVIDLASVKGREFQEQALGQYGKLLGEDTVANQIAAQQDAARQAAQDRTMQAQQAVAPRGLGGTSLGLNAILGQSGQLANQLGAIQASAPELRKQNLNFATGGINQILGEQGQSRILKMGQAAGPRTGGLAPLIGAGVGGLLGGPAGAGIGMSAGQYATQMG